MELKGWACPAWPGDFCCRLAGLESETPGESRATRTLGSGPRLGGRGSRAAACETVPSRGSPGHVCRGVGRAP